jgi:hypothetical protein
VKYRQRVGAGHCPRSLYGHPDKYFEGIQGKELIGEAGVFNKIRIFEIESVKSPDVTGSHRKSSDAGTGLQPVSEVIKQARLIFTSISLLIYIILGAGKMPAPAENPQQ